MFDFVFLALLVSANGNQVPQFAGPSASSAVFNVMEFGAMGDGKTDDTQAITEAYRACKKSASGGAVVFPSGHIFVAGPLALQCNHSVTIIEKGATVQSLDNTSAWPVGADCPEPAQGKTATQMAPFLHMSNLVNVTVTGGGSVDALGDIWWREACGNWWCPEGHTIQNPKAFRPYLFRIDDSVDVTVTNITMRNPGFWNLVPVHCDRVKLTDLTITAEWREGVPRAPSDSYRTPNTDGLEPMWTSNVLIQNIHVKNGDDCMTVKSGSSNILVEDFYCEHGDGLTIGSVWYDNVENVTFRRVVMNRTHNGPMIKGRSQGNATVRDITFEDIELHSVYLALTIDCVYETQGSVEKNVGVQVVNVAYRNITGTVIPGEGGGNGANKDPTFLTDASGTFVCVSNRSCSFQLLDISIRHNDSDTPVPPVWLCNHTNLLSSNNVSPKLPPSCTRAFQNYD